MVSAEVQVFADTWPDTLHSFKVRGWCVGMRSQNVILISSCVIWITPPARQRVGSKMASQRRMKTNCTRKIQNKVEKTHVLEPNRPEFEFQFLRSLVLSTVNKLLTSLKGSILVYQKRRLIPHILREFYEVPKFPSCSMHESYYLESLLWCFFSYWCPLMPCPPSPHCLRQLHRLLARNCVNAFL